MRLSININYGQSTRDAFNEADHPREGGKFASKGGGSSASGGHPAPQSQKISAAALKEKLEGMPYEKLVASLKNPAVDPAIKKHIEKELDSRANRGTMKGHRET